MWLGYEWCGGVHGVRVLGEAGLVRVTFRVFSAVDVDGNVLG